jgi:hypothetical protein
MQIEGVLMRPVAQSPISEGLLIYRGLASVAAVILISGETEQRVIDGWLLTQNLTQHGQVIYPDKQMRHYSVAENRVLQVNRLRAIGYALELVIVPEPDVAARLIEEGYNCLQFTHAAYAVPSWRPDYAGAVRPWDELSRQVADQARLRSVDERMEKENNEAR